MYRRYTKTLILYPLVTPCTRAFCLAPAPSPGALQTQKPDAGVFRGLRGPIDSNKFLGNSILNSNLAVLELSQAHPGEET